MQVDTLVVGFLKENCYIASKGKKAIIIDPGDEADRIIDHCRKYDVVEVLITHHHFDHVGALNKILKEYGLEENKPSGYFNYEIIDTPGHTSDSKTYYFKDDKIMFTGDFLFYHTIGRTDLETSSDMDMKKSLIKIFKYPLDIMCYPGHGRPTTLKEESSNNYFRA